MIAVKILISTVAYVVIISVVQLVGGESVTTSGWVIVSSLLTAVVLSVLCLRSRLHGAGLSFALFVLLFGVSHLLNILDAILFGLQVPTWGLFWWGIMGSALFSVLLVVVLGRWRGDGTVPCSCRDARLWFGYVWRALVCAVIYVILYAVAGAIVFPYVERFYESLQMPSASQLLAFQLVRGMIYVASAFLLMTNSKGKSLETGILTGVAFSILGGVAPLLMPNPYMPPDIRLAHGIEIGVSNFAFGFVVGLLFSKHTLKLRAAEAPAGSPGYTEPA